MKKISSSISTKTALGKFLFIPLLVASLNSLHANGIYRDGVGAKSMSMGGADVAWGEDPLTSLSSNPAGLGFLQGNQVDLGVAATMPTGHFINRADSNGHMEENLTAFPEGAAGFRLGNSPISVGLGVFPKSGLIADWQYNDVPGGADGSTTYGRQLFKSEILVLRTAFGLSIQLTKQLTVGASLGLIYNENKLTMPYIFQDEPALPPGFKTLLRLQTDGWGADGNFGVQYRPLDTLSLGVSYHTGSHIVSHGDAWGDAGAQLNNIGLGGAQHTFHYDAEVDNDFPQSISTGVSWKVHPQWTISGQIDWVDWSTFSTLPVKLTNGSNLDVNGVVGSSSLNDRIPLNWSDQLVYRAGVEYEINENWSLRGGYIFGKSPVPTSTITPLTAVITEHTLTAGVGYKRGPFGIDAGYQYSFPASRSVGNTSILQAGEADGSTVKVSIHTFAITASYKF